MTFLPIGSERREPSDGKRGLDGKGFQEYKLHGGNRHLSTPVRGHKQDEALQNQTAMVHEKVTFGTPTLAFPLLSLRQLNKLSAKIPPLLIGRKPLRRNKKRSFDLKSDVLPTASSPLRFITVLYSPACAFCD